MVIDISDVLSFNIKSVILTHALIIGLMKFLFNTVGRLKKVVSMIHLCGNAISTLTFIYFDCQFISWYIYIYLQTISGIHSFMCSYHPKLRGKFYTFFIPVTSTSFNNFLWLNFGFLPFKIIVGNYPVFVVLAWGLSIMGVIQTFYNFDFGLNVYVDLKDKTYYKTFERLKTHYVKPDSFEERSSLKIFQITDSHLGAFKSIDSLKDLCKKVVKLNPDFVFLTGDFYTLETRGNDGALLTALEPLKVLKGKVVACLGNHEYEDGQYHDIVTCLKGNDVIVLEDDQVFLDSKVGKIQVLGTKFYFSRYLDNINNIMEKFPRSLDVKAHFTLLHNPNHFKFLKDGFTDLVFSGHLHGGLVGLNSFGINFTLLALYSLVNKIIGRNEVIPDNGLWGLFSNRLYSHRGTGHNGFISRIGVTSEETVMNVLV